MRILLLGGTGVIGSYLINVLCDKGFKVVVTSRSYHESNAIVEYRQGDAKNIHFLYSILKEPWDSIVDFMNYSTEEFSQRKDLLLRSTSQYVFLSSARVYDNYREALTEESLRLLDNSKDKDFLLTNEYSLSKARQENILSSSPMKNWVIVRPYITYGEKRLQLGTFEKENWLYRSLNGRTIVFSKDIGNHFTTLTYGLDLATGIACLISNSNTLGEVYHIMNEHAFKWSEILNIYLDVLEERLAYRPKVIFQNLEEFLKWNSGRYQIIYDRLFDRRFDCNKIKSYININEFIQVQDGLRKCLNEFLIDPKFSKIDWSIEAIKDRYTKERTPLKEIDGFKQRLKYLVFRYFKNKINL